MSETRVTPTDPSLGACSDAWAVLERLGARLPADVGPLTAMAKALAAAEAARPAPDPQPLNLPLVNRVGRALAEDAGNVWGDLGASKRDWYARQASAALLAAGFAAATGDRS